MNAIRVIIAFPVVVTVILIAAILYVCTQ